MRSPEASSYCGERSESKGFKDCEASMREGRRVSHLKIFGGFFFVGRKDEFSMNPGG